MATDQANKFDLEFSKRHQVARLDEKQEKSEKHDNSSADSEHSSPMQPVRPIPQYIQPFVPPMPMYYGMPFIRYVNGDMATLTGRMCDCGNPLPLIEKIDGRKLDIIHLEDIRKKLL